MVTGASTAELAIVLVDARHGVRPAVAPAPIHRPRCSGVRHVVVAVNKMDLVGWDERRFDEIAAEFGSFAARLDIADLTVDPCGGAAR